MIIGEVNEMKVISSQLEFIEDKFGEDVDMNLGYYISEDYIATKIYGENACMVMSYMNYDGTKVKHEIHMGGE